MTLPQLNLTFPAPLGELWRVIEEFPYYEVSNMGRIRRITPSRGTWNGRILKFQLSNVGYLRVFLRRNNEPFPRSVHRLVAIAFIPEIKGKEFVNHKNGVKSDNRQENLEWCTRGENVHQAFVLGLNSSVGERHPRHKLTWGQVCSLRNICSLPNKPSYYELGRKYGVHWSTIRSAVVGKNWK